MRSISGVGWPPRLPTLSERSSRACGRLEYPLRTRHRAWPGCPAMTPRDATRSYSTTPTCRASRWRARSPPSGCSTSNFSTDVVAVRPLRVARRRSFRAASSGATARCSAWSRGYRYSLHDYDRDRSLDRSIGSPACSSVVMLEQSNVLGPGHISSSDRRFHACLRRSHALRIDGVPRAAQSAGAAVRCSVRRAYYFVL